MKKMIEAIVNFLRRFFGDVFSPSLPPLEPLPNVPGEELPIRRPPEVARQMADTARRVIGSNNEEYISCPWHMDPAAHCYFNKTKKLFRCSYCGRNGSLNTLMTRLDAKGVYEEEVK